jgi:malonate-semialdehyde dehydrogenase (acetylating) / methylmalonate-semialdehyde dehydrogenase
LSVVNPATGKELATVSDIDRDGLERAISAAREAFPTWNSTPYRARKTVLIEMVHVIEQHMEELSALLTSEHGHSAASAKWEIEWLTKLITAYTRMPCGSRDGLRNE